MHIEGLCNEVAPLFWIGSGTGPSTGLAHRVARTHRGRVLVSARCPISLSVSFAASGVVRGTRLPRLFRTGTTSAEAVANVG